jgi:hypothetical protein
MPRWIGSTADQTWSLVRAKITFVPEVEHALRVWLHRDWSEPAAISWRRAIERHAPRFHDGGAGVSALSRCGERNIRRSLVSTGTAFAR